MTGVLPWQWPRTALPPLLAARLRVRPEDFLVEEELPFTLTGAGEHLWLRIRKRGLNSEQVAVALGRAAGVARRDVGYAGMKDRHAETIQWFSLLLGQRPAPDWRTLPPGIEVLEVTRHARKLKTGALSGNRFVLVLREVEGDPDALAQRVEAVRQEGVPNYFGEQRFGWGGENIERAAAMFSGNVPVASRHKRGLYLSSARSLIFNEVLARRVQDASWNRLLDGETVVLDGSRSFFVAGQIDAELIGRLARHDIHPSGPLWGKGEPASRGAVRALEDQVAARYSTLATGLAAAGLAQERRALRLVPRELEVTWLDDATLSLRFGLPAGCYATVLVRELAEYQDVGTGAPAEA
jgi:tRNA pseudouridine13 synthase